MSKRHKQVAQTFMLPPVILLQLKNMAAYAGMPCNQMKEKKTRFLYELSWYVNAS